MASERLIIDITDGISVADALMKVHAVVLEGKISKAGEVRHYCWVSWFRDEVMVAVRRKKKGQTSDSFIVYREK